MAHLYLGSFSNSSLQILSSSVRLDVEHHCTAIFKSLQGCSIGFKSGVWLGHSRIFGDLFRSHSGIVLAVLLRVLVLLEGEPSPQFEVLNILEQIFIKALSVLCSVQLSLDPD